MSEATFYETCSIVAAMQGQKMTNDEIGIAMLGVGFEIDDAIDVMNYMQEQISGL